MVGVLLEFPWLSRRSGVETGLAPGRRPGVEPGHRVDRARDQGGRRPTWQGGEGARGRPREVVAVVECTRCPRSRRAGRV